MTFKMTVLGSDFTCGGGKAGGAGTAQPEAIIISAAVGNASPPRCRNLRPDVKTIQRALNRFKPIEGGPSPALVDDGFCGTKTKRAIMHFQQKWDLIPKGWKVPDGIVDINGATIRRLRLGPGAISRPASFFMQKIPRVIGVLSTARSSLTLARHHYRTAATGPGPIPAIGGFSQLAAERVERHFHLSQHSDPVAAIDRIDRAYLDMLTAIGHIPQGILLAADEPSTVARGTYMFTFGGAYREGLSVVQDGLAVARVYCCPKSRTLNEAAFIYAVIHELAHLTGPRFKDSIDDIAYFHKTPQKYRQLSAVQALTNADCYSQYAYDAINRRGFRIDLNSVS